jgi:NhaA family Na+:H+ antiporter
MAVPAVVYLLISQGQLICNGWAIPGHGHCLAMGLSHCWGAAFLARCGCLLTVAVVDDLGAVIVIALAYTAC